MLVLPPLLISSSSQRHAQRLRRNFYEGSSRKEEERHQRNQGLVIEDGARDSEQGTESAEEVAGGLAVI